MIVQQLSVFLENRAGRLDEVATVLAENGVNILALTLADTADFGILRMIVSDVETAQKVLSSENFLVKTTEVIAVQVPDEPGGLEQVLKVLRERSCNVEYMYGFTGKNSGNAVMIFRFEDAKCAAIALNNAGVEVLEREQVLSW